MGRFLPWRSLTSRTKSFRSAPRREACFFARKALSIETMMNYFLFFYVNRYRRGRPEEGGGGDSSFNTRGDTVKDLDGCEQLRS
mmetsp:Transcript_36007/g.102512  ORF Transcript_36007/g.102512 Transcript_36007/m.102512 type:complete len:84 (+) Transcript_36007:2295-2546(+)